MKRILTILLCAALLLTLAACGSEPTPTTEATVPTEPAAPDATIGTQQPTPTGTPDYIQISYSDAEGNFASVTAYDDGAGMACVEYQGAERKQTTMELTVMAEIAQAVEESGLAALNGRNEFQDGLASASVYVSYSDGSSIGAGFSGVIPQEFMDGYGKLDAFMVELMKDVPLYVARPVVLGEVAEKPLEEMIAMLDASGMEPLDGFTISDVAKDGSFGDILGLKDTTGVVDGTICNPMMSVSAYQCVIVTLDESANAEALQKDFLTDVAWNKWVCVSASHALVAEKDNMLLCVMGTQEMYDMTVTGLEATGWTVLETATAN